MPQDNPGSVNAEQQLKIDSAADIIDYAPKQVGGIWSDIRTRLAFYTAIEKDKFDKGNAALKKAVQKAGEVKKRRVARLLRTLNELDGMVLLSNYHVKVESRDGHLFGRIDVKLLRNGSVQETCDDVEFVNVCVSVLPKKGRNLRYEMEVTYTVTMRPGSGRKKTFTHEKESYAVNCILRCLSQLTVASVNQKPRTHSDRKGRVGYVSTTDWANIYNGPRPITIATESEALGP